MLVALFAWIIVLNFWWQNGLFAGNFGIPAWVLAVTVVALFVPALPIVANKKDTSPSLTPIDQTLQLVFYGLWLASSLAYTFFSSASLLILATALLVLLIILARAFFLTKPAPKATNSGRNNQVNKTIVLLSLNVLTIWLPFGFLAGMMTYISAAYGSYPDSGLAIIPVIRMLAPLLIMGLFVAVATLAWSVRCLAIRRSKLGAMPITLLLVLSLLSVAYLIFAAQSLIPTIVSFHLLV